MLQKRAILWVAVSSLAQATSEKTSLIEQEHQLMEVAAAQSWKVVDTIVVPGHSRDYYTFAEFCNGIKNDKKLSVDDPLRMWDHWKNRDFDIFACMDGSRFGREQSIIAEIIGRTYDAGAQIYSHKDGWIERNNKRWFAMLTGIQASSEIDELKRRHRFGMNKRAQLGLPMSAKTPLGYNLIRDQKGKAIRMEVDEGQRRFWDDVFDLLVNEKTSWRFFEKRLAERGHLHKGKQYHPFALRRVLYSPPIWGHTARNHTERNGFRMRRGNREWAYNPQSPAPDGVLIFYNTHEPIYKGEQASIVKSELTRRLKVVRGRARASGNSPYASILVCGECGQSMIQNKHGNLTYYRCTQRSYASFRDEGLCSQTKRTPIKTIDSFFYGLLSQAQKTGELDEAIADLFASTKKPEQVDFELVQNELHVAKGKARKLIAQRLDAPPNLYDVYDDSLKAISEQIETLESLLKKQPQAPSKSELGDIDNLDDFFNLPPADFNQRLHRILNGRRFVILDRQIIRVIF